MNGIARSSTVASSSSRSASANIQGSSRKMQQSQVAAVAGSRRATVASMSSRASSSSSRRQSQSNSRKHEQQGKQQRDGAATRAAATRRGERERRLRGRGGRANARRLQWLRPSVPAGRSKNRDRAPASDVVAISGIKRFKGPGVRAGERSFGCHPTATHSRPAHCGRERPTIPCGSS